MRFVEIIWRQRFAEKLIVKHGLYPDEVEEVFANRPLTRRQERGHQAGQDLYVAYGRTDAGRYVTVFFIRKDTRAALPISARDMTPRERTYYERTK